LKNTSTQQNKYLFTQKLEHCDTSLRNHYVRIREIGDDDSCFVLTYFPFVNFEKKALRIYSEKENK
jgi:hypothetical protein